MSAAVVNKAKKIKLKNRSAKAVLLYLADCWSEKHGCFPTQERIAEDLEISLRTVKRSIKWLEQDGHIIRHFQTDGGRIIRTYYALFNGVTMTPLMVSPRHHQWCHHDTINGVTMTPSYIRILNDNKNDNKNVSACAFSEPPAAADSGAASEPPATSLSPASNPPASESPGIDREAALQRFCSDLEEWYAATLGVTRLPYDPQTIDGVAWLFENDFTLADIKAFYTWATTDPDQTRWRKGRVTIGAIVKGIADWRKDTRQSDTEKQAADDISLCPECRGDAMIPVFNGDEQVGVRRCRHVGLVAASQALW